MGKEIQSEKLPIFDSQKSTKSTIKLLKMSQLKAFKVDQTFCNTLYLHTIYLHTIYTDHESVQLAAVPAVEVAVGGRLGLGQAGHALLAANTWTGSG